MMKIRTLDIPNPIVLAPMEDVSDPPFRILCRRFGADIVYTEFISSEGLIRHAKKSVHKLDIFDEERPVAIQIFGNQIGPMVEAAQMAESVKPDFIDINYGCPAKAVAGRGAGSGLLCNPDLMEDLTRAIVKAVKIPVTAKTRIGWDSKSISILDTLRRLEDCGIQALTIHGRTREQMFKGVADWTWIRKAKEVARIPIIGNGDVCTAQDAKRLFDETGCDGVMIGRASIGNPWIFREAQHYCKTGELLPPPTYHEKIHVALEHLKKSVERKGEKYGVLEMRRHYSVYLKGLPNVSELRSEVVRIDDPKMVEERLLAFEAACDHHFAEAPSAQLQQHEKENVEMNNGW
jgi:tRNA-dihydrouridine synthase B